MTSTLPHYADHQAILDTALETAERIHENPAATWEALGELDRDTLQAVTVALAAIVDLSQPGALKWLQKLPERYEDGDGLAASGLATLLPTHAGQPGTHSA